MAVDSAKTAESYAPTLFNYDFAQTGKVKFQMLQGVSTPYRHPRQRENTIPLRRKSLNKKSARCRRPLYLRVNFISFVLPKI